MTMQTDSLVQTEFDNRIGRRSAPVRLVLGIRAFVPEIGAVAVFRTETRFILFQFKLFPVESDRRGIEQCSVQLLVRLVAGIAAELVVIENMRTENKLAFDLLHLDFGTGGNVSGLEKTVRFTIGFNIAINFCLDFAVPAFPVSRTHHPVLFFYRHHGNSPD